MSCGEEGDFGWIFLKKRGVGGVSHMLSECSCYIFLFSATTQE